MSEPEHVSAIVGRIMREMEADLARLQEQEINYGPPEYKILYDLKLLPRRLLRVIQGGKP